MKKKTNCPKAEPGIQSPARAHVAPGHRSLTRPPHNEQDQNAIGDAMCAWAHQESSFDIEAFPLSLYMSPPKLWKIAETNEYFADCLKFTRLMLYIRRSEMQRQTIRQYMAD